MMINDAKTCNCTTNDSNSMLQRTDTMLSNLRALTECLHRIDSDLNRISMTMFSVDVGEMANNDIKDMDTEIKYDGEIARGILEKINLLIDRMGLN